MNTIDAATLSLNIIMPHVALGMHAVSMYAQLHCVILYYVMYVCLLLYAVLTSLPTSNCSPIIANSSSSQYLFPVYISSVSIVLKLQHVSSLSYLTAQTVHTMQALLSKQLILVCAATGGTISM
jgi:hypothetical protein